MENEVEFKRLERAVDDIRETLNQVHVAIVGSELAGDGGMAKRLKDAEAKLEELEIKIFATEKKQIRYNIYTVIMWICIGAVTMGVFMYALPIFFKK